MPETTPDLDAARTHLHDCAEYIGRALTELDQTGGADPKAAHEQATDAKASLERALAALQP